MNDIDKILANTIDWAIINDKKKQLQKESQDYLKITFVNYQIRTKDNRSVIIHKPQKCFHITTSSY